MNKERYAERLKFFAESGNMRMLKTVEPNGFLIDVNGKEMLNLSSNDYLGLSSSPVLMKEFREEYDMESLSYASTSSRLLAGNHKYYTLIEEDLAGIYEREAALYFNSGYHANIGILPSLAGPRDLIVADKSVHASMIDGMRLSEAKMMRFRHTDYGHLEFLLDKYREEYENVFIVTESVFSMDGDEADLLRLCDIKSEYDAFLYVDEAHAVGVRGTNGLGCCEEKACTEDVDFIVGTCGKAFASVGAYVICDNLFREYLINTQRSFIFTTALPPVNIAWMRFVLRHMPDFYDMRERLRLLGERLRKTIADKGFVTGGSSHIVPLVCGPEEETVALAELVCENGFFVQPVRYPTVPKGEARIRFSLNAAIPDEEYECLYDFLKNGLE